MGFLNAIFGGTPQVPKWDNISLDQQQQQATQANQAALPGIEKLATGFNSYSQDQISKMLENIIPGWASLSKDIIGNISSEVKGQIPTDVSNAIQSSDAARALTGGFGGSGLAGNMTARDLGLTSLDLTRSGTSSFEKWTSTIDQLFAPGMFNISSMFITPAQEFAATMQNQEQAVAQKWMQNQVNAMPDPVLGGINSEVMSLMSAYLGGGGNFSTKGGTGSPGAVPSSNFSMSGESSGTSAQNSWNSGEAKSMLGTAFF